jgi:hypothetical protein
LLVIFLALCFVFTGCGDGADDGRPSVVPPGIGDDPNTGTHLFRVQEIRTVALAGLPLSIGAAGTDLPDTWIDLDVSRVGGQLLKGDDRIAHISDMNWINAERFWTGLTHNPNDFSVALNNARVPANSPIVADNVYGLHITISPEPEGWVFSSAAGRVTVSLNTDATLPRWAYVIPASDFAPRQGSLEIVIWYRIGGAAWNRNAINGVNAGAGNLDNRITLNVTRPTVRLFEHDVVRSIYANNSLRTTGLIPRGMAIQNVSITGSAWGPSRQFVAGGTYTVNISLVEFTRFRTFDNPLIDGTNTITAPQVVITGGTVNTLQLARPDVFASFASELPAIGTTPAGRDTITIQLVYNL